MTSPSGAVCLYITGCAGAVCYIGGLVSAECHQEIWMIAALSTAIVLLTGVTVALVADYWAWRRRARQLVRGIEEWMQGGVHRDDGHWRG